MVATLIVILFLAWLLVYTPLFGDLGSVLAIPLITLFGRTITVWDILIFLLVIWLIGVLPSPLREIAFVIFALWVLSILGIFALFPGLSGILILLIIVSAIFSLIGGSRTY